MDFKQIQSIIKDFEKSSIQSLELELEGTKMKLSKNGTTFKEKEEVAIFETKTNDSNPILKQEEILGIQIKSPLVGTYYASSSPKDQPFTAVGQYVEKGTTVCIVEAMKIMNEISAPVSGTIEKILLKDGAAVGYDQVLLVMNDAK